MSRTGDARWYRWLALISIVSLLPSVLWVLTRELHVSPTGDAWYFHWQAALIANGSG